MGKVKKKRDSYSDAKPSEVTKEYWIYAERQQGEYPEFAPRSGKWLIFVPEKDIDEVWAKIKKATEEGKLGGAMERLSGGEGALATDLKKKEEDRKSPEQKTAEAMKAMVDGQRAQTQILTAIANKKGVTVVVKDGKTQVEEVPQE